MDKKTKEALVQAFEAPKPEKKEMFLDKIGESRTKNSFISFLFYQVKYIRKIIWIASLLILILAYSFRYMTFAIDKDAILILASFTPFIAATFLTENYRSYYYGMNEMEAVTRFSLKSVLLSRMVVVGAVHLCLLCILLPLIMQKENMNVIRIGIYFLVPYLLTTALGLFATRYSRGKEGGYVFAGISILICISNLWMENQLPRLYVEQNFYLWIITCIVLFCIAIVLYIKMLKCIKEESIWNLL